MPGPGRGRRRAVGGAEEEKKEAEDARMLTALQTGNNAQHLWMIAAGLGVGFLVVTGLVVFLMRKSFQIRREGQREELAANAPRTAKPSAFMTASMQGGIQQLRDQEKELERLQPIEKEGGEQTGRL